MNQHRFALALCTLVSCLLLVDVANAYPTTSSGTLSKGYRPIDVEFNTLVEGADYGVPYSTGPKLTENGTVLDSVTLVFEADWTVSDGFTYPDYDSGGFAGVWVFELDPQSTGLSVIQNGDTFIVSAPEGGVGFGTFTYLGGFVGNVPVGDTPLPGDVFKLFTTPLPGAGASLAVTVLNEEDFAVQLNGELVHVGPYTLECYTGGCPPAKVCLLELDDDEEDGRNTPGCDDPLDAACVGRVTALNATSVPEPGTLALFGLGLAGLGIRFRSRRKALLV